LYGLYVFPFGLSRSIFSALSSAPASSGAMRIAAGERAPQRRGPARSRGGTGTPEVAQAEGARHQRSVHRTGTYIHSPPPPPLAALHIAPVALEPR